MMKYLDELVIALQRVVEQHFDDEILSNIAITFLTFHNNIAVEQHISSARAQMLDHLAVSLKRSLQLFERGHALDEQDEAQMLNGFRKINAFIATEDLRRTDLWDLQIFVLQNSNKISNPYISEKAIIHAFLTLSWDIQRLLKGAEPNINDAARQLKPKTDKFMDVIKHFLSSSATGVENAFLCLCDLLILLNWKVSSDFPDTEIANLEIILHKDFKDKINSFVVDNVFVSEENDPIHTFDQYQQIELLAKRRNLLSQFCKLIMHGVIPISDASLVLRYYVKYHTDYGDILKALLNKCREIDRISCASAISAALINSFEDLLLIFKGKIDPVEEEFIAIRDLAKRFALSFGPDATRNREAIATIHKLGIVHSLKTTGSKKQYQKLAFLEVLIEFSPRLLRQDKQAVLKYLEKQREENHKNIDDEILANNDAWQPYLLYRSSLQDKQAAHADDLGSVRSFAQPAPGRGRRGPRRRKDTTPTPSEFSVS
uniref:Cohesin subunit SA-1 n=1 Tax=Panagrolaimus davidi TaxID=227884 RepID=A0A914Q8D6_9BILA